jgi:hypothetical protein
MRFLLLLVGIFHYSIKLVGMSPSSKGSLSIQLQNRIILTKTGAVETLIRQPGLQRAEPQLGIQIHVVVPGQPVEGVKLGSG